MLWESNTGTSPSPAALKFVFVIHSRMLSGGIGEGRWRGFALNSGKPFSSRGLVPSFNAFITLLGAVVLLYPRLRSRKDGIPARFAASPSPSKEFHCSSRRMRNPCPHTITDVWRHQRKWRFAEVSLKDGFAHSDKNRTEECICQDNLQVRKRT